MKIPNTNTELIDLGDDDPEETTVIPSSGAAEKTSVFPSSVIQQTDHTLHNDYTQVIPHVDDEYPVDEEEIEEVDYVPPELPDETEKDTNDLAIAGFIVSFVLWPIGLILCIVAHTQINKKKQKGIGFVVGGYIVSVISIIITILLIVGVIPKPTLPWEVQQSEQQTAEQKSLPVEGTQLDDQAEPTEEPSTSDAMYNSIQDWIDKSSDVQKAQDSMKSLTDAGYAVEFSDNGDDTLGYNITLPEELQNVTPDQKAQLDEQFSSGTTTSAFSSIAQALDQQGFDSPKVNLHISSTDNSYTFDKLYNKDGEVN